MLPVVCRTVVQMMFHLVLLGCLVDANYSRVWFIIMQIGNPEIVCARLKLWKTHGFITGKKTDLAM